MGSTQSPLVGSQLAPPGQPAPMQPGEYVPVGKLPLLFQRPTGPGRIVQGTLGPPLTGVDVSYTIGGGVLWRIIGLQFTLVTSAVVANRQVDFIFGNQGPIRIASPANQTAGTTVNYSMVIAVNTYTGASGTIVIGVPDTLFLGQNDKIRTITTNIDVGDKWTVANYFAEEWLDLG